MRQLTYRDVKVSGIRLRVSEAGSGPAVLLLHTAFMDRTCWNAVIEALAPRFRVVAPDLPGFGESEKPAESRFSYTVEAFAHVVTDLFAGLELGQGCVVGHGLGGAVAICLASRHPELVSRLMLVDALCYPARLDPTRRLSLIPIVGSFLFKQLWGKALFRSYFRDVLSAQAIAPQRIDHYYAAFNTPAARNSTFAALRATQDTRTVVAAVSRIQVPTLVVWGRYDAVYPAALGQRLAREVRGAGFELLDCGHSPPEEQAARLGEVSKKFFLAERA